MNLKSPPTELLGGFLFATIYSNQMLLFKLISVNESIANS